MESVELADLSPQAADLVARAAGSDEVVITEAGRPIAKLIPVKPRTWRPWGEVAGLFASSSDPDWTADRGTIFDPVRDPGERLTGE